MACEKYREMAIEEVDGELEDSRSLLLMRHLVSCESCRIYYDKHLRLFEVMKEKIAGDLIAVPEGFSSSVMAGIEKDVLQATQIPDYSTSFLSSIIIRLKSLTFTPASLYPVAALSVLLIVVVAGLRYDKTGSNDTSMLPLANAKGIKAESINRRALKAEAEKEKGSLSYYLSRHEAKTYRSTGKPISRSGNLVYTSYNAVNR